MRFGIVAAVLAALVLVAALGVPAPESVPELPQGPAPTAAAFPICLVLELAEPERHTELLQLTDSLVWRSSSGTWFAATRLPVDHWTRGAAWRPAGVDSIEIGWHHSPLVRLPAAGHSRIGLAHPREHINLVQALFSQPTPARAREMACPTARALAA